MNVALIVSSSDAVTDSRALRTARALRVRGHQATFVVAHSDGELKAPPAGLAWQGEGFASIPVSGGPVSREPAPTEQLHFPRDPALLTARALAGVVRAFDVAWFFEAEWAMPALRERRFQPRQVPLVVLDQVETPDLIPASLAEMNRVFARGYAAQWADLTFTSRSGQASLPAEDRIAQAEERWHQLRAAPPAGMRAAATSPAVTVCLPYYEKPEFLPEALQSLDRQTSTDFTVVVVDDGSPSAEAQAVFAACWQRYAARGWRFLRQPNAGASAARNRAVEEATTEFVVFLDTDDIAMPRMVEEFLRAALLTGDDCLVARNYGFADDPEGPCTLFYDPPGNSLIASMGDDMHGGSCMIFRREAFLRLGGFTTVRGVGFEDYELHVRSNLLGLRWDVLPELVYRYRAPQADGVSRSTTAYANLSRVSRWYRERLQPYGLGQLPLAFASAYWKREHAEETIYGLERQRAPRLAKPWPRGREVKLLLLTCNFPYGMVSGWHTRVQQMVRYLGSRYQITLVTSMPREQLAPLRQEAFAHLHGIIGVEGSNIPGVAPTDLPARVQEHYTEVYTDALRQLPSDQYHAAIMDQIFLAEFRHHLDTVPVLTEHNIESRLLRQASERTWTGELPLHYRNAHAEAVRLERYEDLAWRDIPLRVAVSEQDKIQMDERVPEGRTVVAPNGADPASWLQDVRFEAGTVLFVGHLAYLPNVDAVEYLLDEIWPIVRRLRPNARLLVAGRSPAAAVQAAFARCGGSKAGVELVASPGSMPRVARRASISIAPLRMGSGTRCKILESMAWGLPVVGTTLGAEGIAVEDGEHVLIRDGAGAFAEGIVQLLSDEPLWQRLRTASGELIRERYAWDRVFDPFNEALLELIADQAR
jgi:glycosyltransferase involved in cell wall biosynthesis